MKHAALLELRLTHSFTTDGRCLDFGIEPSAETARLLRGHRCLVRRLPSGLLVLSPLDASTGQPFLPLPSGTVLRFHLDLQNNDFALFTDLSDPRWQDPLPVFTNAGLPAGTGGELSLSSERPGGARVPGVFADVRLTMGLRDGADAPVFRVAFTARQWRWAYYCVTDLPPNGADLSIVDAAPAGTPSALLFSDANRTRLDETPDPSDPIAAQILGRYQGMRCIRMLSDQAVTCRQEPRKQLELRRGGDRLLGSLPNPSLQSVSRMSASKTDFLYQIVKYRAFPFV